ncbi:MAG: Lipoprotein-releasing system ATP-binding protein LolD [Chlamydiia bacterium]|nr:Lipoprotein-releasing system ATP-binding protein LolD [Chlamydiia bacterium]MCH9615786.1 Lipoprotein-releasing system ATP-binding protein LolD [Chlamydiia bacterium]MCH9628811.1 Lipoprotein-releasing system ATP-binding protein LolD [Chlamydiia bacterium]
MSLDAKNVYKNYGDLQILSDVSLRVEKGQTVAIVGPSGAGKSTLLHILGTLDSPSSGKIELLGEPISSKNVSRFRNKHIGFVFQSFHLIEDFSTLDNVLVPAMIARTQGVDGMQLLERCDMADKAHVSAKYLSGGEKQRLSIARAFCNNPELIFADEPSGNLDSENSRMIHELLVNSAKELGKSLIVVTHDTSLSKMCDVCYTLSDGKLCES